MIAELDLCPHCDAELPERLPGEQVICDECNRAVIDVDGEDDDYNPEE